MKYKVGDIIIFKTTRRIDNTGSSINEESLNWGIIDRVHSVTDINGIKEYYSLPHHNVLEKDVVSKVVTETV